MAIIGSLQSEKVEDGHQFSKGKLLWNLTSE